MEQIKSDANIQTLRKISSIFNETHTDMDGLLGIVIDTATKVVGVKLSSLLMKDEKTNNLSFYQASGEKHSGLKQFEIPSGMGIAGMVAETGEAIISNHVQNDERWLRQVSDSVSVTVQAIASFPIKIDDLVIGVVQFLDKQDNSEFTEEDVTTLGLFTEMIASFFKVTISKNKLTEEFDRLRQKYLQKYTIVGESHTIKRCISQAEKVADSKAAVLITGESGTGKELFAHLIHERSQRQNQPFVSVNCGALPGSILERELFGHEKGAFTGADSRKIGLFEAADNGTLFLDEIGEMPVDMQVKLLRVLQEETFMRLGGTTPIKVDVRIISATNQDLEKNVRENTFRQDLFYRINVINIKIPSLRERPEDISDLVAFFLKKHKPDNQPVKKLAKGLLAHLSGYNWPGNIRELENSVERAIVLADGDTLTVEHFPFDDYQPPIEVNVGATLKEANDTFRRTFIKNTLKSTAGNRTRAAKILDVQRSYLSRLIKELEIDE